MSTMTRPSTLEHGGSVLQATIDQLSVYESQPCDKLTPEDVISLIQDVCIETRCKVSDLPHAVTTIYDEAHKRRDKPEHGHVDFIISTLIHDVERELKKAV